ncbi:hypothetical protein D3C72_2219320 [compost metagenome]
MHLILNKSPILISEELSNGMVLDNSFIVDVLSTLPDLIAVSENCKLVPLLNVSPSNLIFKPSI